jgi:eukaryotic-like serine/threonine-protein kinase
MGIVYAATNAENELVALKLMSPDYAKDGGYRRRFDREANAAMRLESPNAVRIFEAGIDKTDPIEHQPFMVMELLEGRTLEAILEAEGPPSVRTAVGWMLGALHAIAEAHEKGLIHRDIKASNLFLTSSSTSTLKVLDFGIVKDIDPQLTMLTRTGESLGTPAYMSPEQVRALPDVDARADVWSIGVTLYELLTGSMPFNSRSVPDLLKSILTDEPASLRSKRSDIPEALDRIVMRCLSKARDARFASGRELRAALVDLGFDEPKVDERASQRQVAMMTTTALDPLATTTPDFLPPKERAAKPPKRPRRETPRALIFGASALAVLLLGAIGVMVLARISQRPPTTVASTAPPTGVVANLPPPASASAVVVEPEPTTTTATATAPTTASPTSGRGVSPEGSSSSSAAATSSTGYFFDAGPSFGFVSPAPARPKNIVVLSFPDHRFTKEEERFTEWASAIKGQLNTCIKEVRPCQDSTIAFHKNRTVVLFRHPVGTTRTGVGSSSFCDGTGKSTACIKQTFESHIANKGIFEFECRNLECDFRVNILFADDSFH